MTISMLEDSLNAIELLFAENALPGLYNPADPSDWPALRSRMRKTAYHEAGHAAVWMFLGKGDQIVSLSLIPNEATIGRIQYRPDYYESILEQLPPPLARMHGYSLLLHLLAGRGAEARMAEGNERESILDEDALCEQEEEQGSDLFRAIRIAKIIVCPGWSQQRILESAVEWIEEMLAIPDVWDCVNTLTTMLLSSGTIENEDVIDVCEKIDNLYLHLPNWRQRLVPKEDEMGPWIKTLE